MFETSEEQLRATMSDSAPSDFKLAKVTSVSGGSPKVTIYGSTEESTKVFPRLKSYSAAVGDIVLMVRQGSSYIILGAVI